MHLVDLFFPVVGTFTFPQLNPERGDDELDDDGETEYRKPYHSMNVDMICVDDEYNQFDSNTGLIVLLLFGDDFLNAWKKKETQPSNLQASSIDSGVKERKWHGCNECRLLLLVM